MLLHQHLRPSLPQSGVVILSINPAGIGRQLVKPQFRLINQLLKCDQESSLHGSELQPSVSVGEVYQQPGCSKDVLKVRRTGQKVSCVQLGETGEHKHETALHPRRAWVLQVHV